MEIWLKNTIAEIERLHTAVNSFSRTHALDPDTTFHLDLSLEEVFTNIVRHGFTDEKPHDICIRIGLEGDSIRIAVEDDGREFNPLLAPTPDFDQPIELRQPGGLGIFLVRTLMDRADYQRRDNKNILQLYKKLNHPRSDTDGDL